MLLHSPFAREAIGRLFNDILCFILFLSVCIHRQTCVCRICLPACLPVCLPVRQSIRPSIRPSVRLPAWPHARLPASACFLFWVFCAHVFIRPDRLSTAAAPPSSASFLSQSSSQRDSTSWRKRLRSAAWHVFGSGGTAVPLAAPGRATKARVRADGRRDEVRWWAGVIR